jgi:hypothetical protein
VFTELRNDDRGGRDVLYPARACPPAPRADCRRARASALVVKDDAIDTRDELRWRWSQGEAVAPGEVGDPRTRSGWNLCLYAGEPATLFLTAAAPAGEPPWTASEKKGFRYAQRATLPGGVRSLTLRPGAEGMARATLRARGAALAVPDLPAVLPVTVQLGSRDVPLCLSARYEAAVVRTNRPGKLRARTKGR